VKRDCILLTAAFLLLANMTTPALALGEFDRHFEIGKDFFDRQQYKLAVPEFSAAIEAAKENAKLKAKALVERGTAYSELTKYDLALKDLGDAIALNPSSALAFNNRGVVYLRSDKPELAKSDFDRALSIEPGNRYALVNRAGSLLTMKGKVDVSPTLKWLEQEKWPADFSGNTANFSCHAVVLTLLTMQKSKEKAAFNSLLDTALTRLNRLYWPYPMLQHFKGKLSAEEVLEKAQESTYSLTQAEAFLGLESLFAGQKDEAAKRFDFVSNHGTINSVEYWLVKHFQSQLKEPAKKSK
jgi:lipoprotein NlpI